MRHSLFSCTVWVLSALMVAEASSAQDIDKKTDSQTSCYSKVSRDTRAKRDRDAQESNLAATGKSSNGESGQASGNCEQADQRMEFLILLLQIMRGPK